MREIVKQIPNHGADDAYDTANIKLHDYFTPNKNNRSEVYKFRKTTQEPTETLSQLDIRLHTITEMCELDDVNFENEEQIVIGGPIRNYEQEQFRTKSSNEGTCLSKEDEISKTSTKLEILSTKIH